MDPVKQNYGEMMRIFTAFFVAMLLGALPLSLSAQERENDHEALRAVLKTSKEAINTANFDLLKPILSSNDFTVITVDNRKFNSLEEFKHYWSGLFEGPDAVLSRIEINPVADEKTKFLAQNIGLVQGTSNDSYHFTDGDTRQMTTRWTAVVEKEAENWKIMSIHFSSNILDNPVLNAVKDKTQNYLIIVGLLGLILGFVLASFKKCSNRKS